MVKIKWLVGNIIVVVAAAIFLYYSSVAPSGSVWKNPMLYVAIVLIAGGIGIFNALYRHARGDLLTAVGVTVCLMAVPLDRQFHLIPQSMSLSLTIAGVVLVGWGMAVREKQRAKL